MGIQVIHSVTWVVGVIEQVYGNWALVLWSDGTQDLNPRAELLTQI